MEKQEIDLKFEVHCENSQGDVYRTYLGKHLLSERHWRWETDTTYLIEVAPVKLIPGEYNLRIETVKPGTGTFKIKNVQVNEATVQDKTRIVVYEIE